MDGVQTLHTNKHTVDPVSLKLTDKVHVVNDHSSLDSSIFPSDFYVVSLILTGTSRTKVREVHELRDFNIYIASTGVTPRDIMQSHVKKTNRLT